MDQAQAHQHHPQQGKQDVVEDNKYYHPILRHRRSKQGARHHQILVEADPLCNLCNAMGRDRECIAMSPTMSRAHYILCE